MTRIRSQQIAVTNAGDVIVGDGSGGGVLITPAGANQTVVFDGSATNWVWQTSLYDSGTETFAAQRSGTTFDGNYLRAVRRDAGSPPVIEISGTDATNSDIMIQPGAGGQLLLPSGYEGNVSSSSAVPNVAWVEGKIYGNDWKASVRLATNGSGDLSGMTYNAASDDWSTGVSVSFDGTGLVDGDRVLIKDATDQRGNGIWVWDATAQKMTRATDADASAEVSGGMATYVTSGATNAQTVYVLSSPVGNASLGTDNLVFTKLVDSSGGGISAGVGINVVGTTVSIDWTNVTVDTTTTDTDQLVTWNGTAHEAITRADFLGNATIGLQGTNGVEFRNGSTPYALLSSPADGQFDIGFGASDTRFRLTRTTGTDASVHLIATDGMLLPAGTTAQRPSAPSAGVFRYNSTDNVPEYYDGTAWQQLTSTPRWASVEQTASTDGQTTFTNFFSPQPLGITDKAVVHIWINGVALRDAEWDFGTAPNEADLIINDTVLGYSIKIGDIIWAKYMY